VAGEGVGHLLQRRRHGPGEVGEETPARDEDPAHLAQRSLAVGEELQAHAAADGGEAPACQPDLLRRGLLRPDEEVVLFNTGSGLKYAGA